MTLTASRVVFALAATLLVASHPVAAGAQRPDSTRATGVRRVQASPNDTVRPPLSPRRAFFYSVLVPGSAQSILGRHRAAALLMLFEGVSLAMIRESAADVREARRTRNDTTVVSWVSSSGTEAQTPTVVPPRFDDEYVATRRSHLEDWIAVLVANHLFAGADAYVAANLWDVPTQLSIRAGPRGPMVVASFRW